MLKRSKTRPGLFMNTANRIIIALFILLLIAAVVLHVRESRRQAFFSESRMLMDTVISIKAWPADSSEAVARAFDEFATVEKKASFHIAESELSQLNNTGTLDLHASSSELLQIGVDFYHRTEGYFDPSFALLQKAYGFYDENGRLPSDEEISQILATGCGLERVLARDDERWLLAPGSLLDFGGLAGGYAIEKAKIALRAASCSAFLIDDAGDIWFEGQKPDGKPWRIAVRDPRDNTALAYVESHQPMAVSTSGDYERFIIIDGRKHGHIMNPLTGRPVDYYSSVTVVASDALTADALSTAVFAMPPETAFAWVDTQNLPVLFLTATGSIHLSQAGQAVFTGVKEK